MGPSARYDTSRGAHRARVVAPTKFIAEYPTYDEEYFIEDILLANQPILQEPSLEMLHNHRYITLRVGHSLAVHSINSEMLFNKSTYGKELLSRMCKIPNARSFRVDYPEEEEEIFVNLIEWVNYGKHTLYKDTFRGSFLRHLKLYILALRYGIEGLAQSTFEVIIDMLVESHPEQMTRAPFWSAVANLVYSHTGIGDDMRSVVTGYTLWYLLNGRAKHFKTKSNTVEDALLALTTLPTTSAFYRIDCSILHENPHYYEAKLDGFFGSARCTNPGRTVWWIDAVEDPLFHVWMAHWKTVKGQNESANSRDGDIYVDDAMMIKGVDDEDERLLESYRGKEVGPADDANGIVLKNEGLKGKKKKSKGRNRAKATKLKSSSAVINEASENPCENTCCETIGPVTPDLVEIETGLLDHHLKLNDSCSIVSDPISFLMGHSFVKSAKQEEWTRLLLLGEELEEAFSHAKKRTLKLEEEKEGILEKFHHTTYHKSSPYYMMVLEFVLIEIEEETRELDKTVRAHPTMVTALEKMKRTFIEEAKGLDSGQQGAPNRLKRKLEGSDEGRDKKRLLKLVCSD